MLEGAIVVLIGAVPNKSRLRARFGLGEVERASYLAASERGSMVLTPDGGPDHVGVYRSVTCTRCRRPVLRVDVVAAVVSVGVMTSGAPLDVRSITKYGGVFGVTASPVLSSMSVVAPAAGVAVPRRLLMSSTSSASL